MGKLTHATQYAEYLLKCYMPAISCNNQKGCITIGTKAYESDNEKFFCY